MNGVPTTVVLVLVLVLVAEDDEAERDLMAFRLEQAGYTVRSRATGPAVLDALGPEIAALVVEQRLPGLDGLQLCCRLREIPPRRTCRY